MTELVAASSPEGDKMGRLLQGAWLGGGGLAFLGDSPTLAFSGFCS